jgi:hypothetical protein
LVICSEIAVSPDIITTTKTKNEVEEKKKAKWLFLRRGGAEFTIRYHPESGYHFAFFTIVGIIAFAIYGILLLCI